MERIGRALAALNGLTMGAGSVAVVLMILHVTADVVMRYAFNSPLPATILFVSVFYMIAVAFLPLSSVEQNDAHISVELVYDLLAGWMQWGLRALSHLLSIAVFGALAWRTGAEALTRHAAGTSAVEAGMRIPTWPAYFVLPLAFGLAVLVFAHKLVCHLTGRRTGFEGLGEGTVAAEARTADSLRKKGGPDV